MTINDLYKKSLKYFLRFVLFLLFSVGIQAQNTNTAKGTQVSDGSVISTVHNPLMFSILDLSSVERGFLLPRMSTEERSAISIVDIKPGLMVYNTTIDCIEFYSASHQMWLSLCGDEKAPAELEISSANCNNITISGNYAEGVFLNSRANVINLQVSVSVGGTYQIEAEAYNGNAKNGYSFVGNGSFPTAGIYNVTLRGSGTPLKGYLRDISGGQIEKGDEIRFVLNGKASNCIAYNFVESKALTYEIDKILPSGEFYTGVSLKNKRSGYIDVYIHQINMGGNVEIFTPEINGIRFRGKRYLTSSEVASKNAIIRLYGEGIPLIPSTLIMDFISNSYVKVELGESPKVKRENVEIARLKINPLCNDTKYHISHEGEFEYNEKLTIDNKINVPVKVFAPGKGRLIGTVDVTGTGFGNQSEKIEFSSEIIDFKFNELNDDVQNVILTPVVGTGKPTVSNKDIVFKFKMVSRGAYEYDNTLPIENNDKEIVGCEYNVPITGAPVQYEILWRNLQIGGKLRPYGAANSNHYLDIPVKVIFPGEAVIESEFAVNGITYKGTKVLTDNDINTNNSVTTVRVYAEGTPIKADQSEFVIKGNSIGNSPQVNPVVVPILYRPMVLLSSGSSSGYRIDAGSKIGLLNNKDYFGPNGLVKIESLIIVSGNHTTATAFSSALTNSKVDIVVGTLNFGFDNNKNNVLYDFLVNKKGAAMINNEANEAYAAAFINLLGGGGSANIIGQSTYHTLNNINDPILVGPFGDLRGKDLGEDVAGRSINNLPSSYIRYDEDASKTWVVRHSKYDFVYTGDSGFMQTNVYKVNGNAAKATVTTGSGSAGGSSRATYNSHFTMNFMSYAIDQIQRNRPNE